MHDRTRAELKMRHELGHERLEAAETSPWPHAARRISEARLAAGLSEVELAQRLGITTSAYADLEAYDDEVFRAITLATLNALGRLLNVSPQFLLIGSVDRGGDPITYEEIGQRLADRITRDGTTVDQFGHTIGWDLGLLLADPQTLRTWDVVGLFNVTTALDLDWVAALPNPRT